MVLPPQNRKNYHSKNLDHLGIVAQMCQELKIAETINHYIYCGDKTVSHGDAVVAMILNGLGFTSQPLYLTPSFFEDKPVDRLIHPELTASQLNAQSLGRTLDAIYDAGSSGLFSQLTQVAVETLGLSCKSIHLDSTSFHMHGDYKDQSPPLEGQEIINITKGYSRDHRPDLNQIILNMIVEQQASLPIWMDSASGNSTDKNDFREIIAAHIDHLQMSYGVEYIIADSALYVNETIQTISSDTYFITRVPETIKGVYSIYQSIDLGQMTPINDNYAFLELGANYGGCPQRWMVIHSKLAEERTMKTYHKRLKKKLAAQCRAFKKLQAQNFCCKTAAEEAVAKFQKKYYYLNLNDISMVEKHHYSHRGKPHRGEIPEKTTYSVTATVSSCLDVIEHERRQKGFFILATNQLDTEALSSQDILNEYKGQQHVEKGFKFIKSHEFMVDSFYLKSTSRIMALLMIMTLCLMVYSAIEYKLRSNLKDENDFINNQKGKPIQNPTARWVFNVFHGIHILYLDEDDTIILNMTNEQSHILEILGKEYQQIYQNHYELEATYRHPYFS